MSTPSRQHYVTVNHSHGNIAVVTFGNLKQITKELQIAAISDRLMELINQEGARQIILDFKGITQMDSQFLGQLIGLHKHLTLQLRGQLVITGLADVMDVFKVTRLDAFLTIAKDPLLSLQRTLPASHVEAGFLLPIYLTYFYISF